MFDALDDYETERDAEQPSGCDYCASIEAMTGSRQCPVHGGGDRPAIAGEADAEYQARIDADRCTWEFRSKRGARVAQRAVSELPLFYDGEKQGGLF